MFSKSVAPLALVGAVAISTAALAATQTTTGEVKSTDLSRHELVLSTGDTFSASSRIKLDKLKPGEKVTVSYDIKNGKMMATKVRPAK